MEKSGFLVYSISFLLITILSCIFLIRNKRVSNKKAKLPPGSMGWPYIGETLQLYSQDPTVFFATKQRRYGEIFKTHLLGCPCVMLASPDASRFVLMTQAHLFKPTYPKSKENLIGPSALFFHQGGYHTKLRKLVQGSLSPEAIRNLVSGIEAIAVTALDSWTGGHVVNTFNEMKKFSFEVGILNIFGHLGASQKEELKKNYSIVDRGYNSFPSNLPGTPYKKALQIDSFHLYALKARKRLSKILNEIICERKEKRSLEKGLLGCLLNFKDEKREILDEDQIADNVIGVLFAAQDTTASIMTWILKYLYDDSKLQETVKAEQKEIYMSNKETDTKLTWRQTRKMPLTHKMILETMRMASIISFTFREAVADVEYKGYLIPKGWKVMPLFRNIHHNPEFFTDPQTFNPSRFENAPKPNTFIPFGTGVHACPGNELAKLEMLVMIHHLVTKFRWEVVGYQRGIQYGPFPVPMHGLPARFWRESTL